LPNLLSLKFYRH